MTSIDAPAPGGQNSVVAKLSTLDRFLAVWILLAMAAGLGLGRLVPGLDDVLTAVELGGISLPIALGLLIMMYPVLAKVRYDKLDAVTGDRRLMASSLVINWIIGPAVMFALAWLFLPDLPEYRTGLIIVGLARCIAMVIIWNDLACGDREAAAVLVALNSVFQVLAFGLLGWFYLDLLPGWLGLGEGENLDISMWEIALNVVVFLGVPLVAGFLTRRLGEKKLGRERYENAFLPKIGPWALYGLLFTIVILFALQGETITSQPLDVVRIALPLLVYFALMWFGTFALGKAIGLPYDRTATLAFTAAGNNFELAIAVAVATFGVTSGQALAGVVGPLIEVPVLVALVYVSLAWRRKFSVDK
ncbi:ACR3 family arsenite efflux transporter [Actinocorallia populi]|uniref:ACR3 family arsenite efflux transporter n=1 Tax=Actinocorallia populi TaxID=2079200 RepID=UPI000D08E51E|nr:ACR3 family arsenite efflux transporter [Actinocorallia populi]